MTYHPRPGDRVTSPLLTGEWEVGQEAGYGEYVWVSSGQARLTIHPIDLTLVAPPPPPEPAVGSVVWAQGRAWLRTNGPWICCSAERFSGKHAYWEDIAADAVPMWPITKVAYWLRYDQRRPAEADLLLDMARASL